MRSKAKFLLFLCMLCTPPNQARAVPEDLVKLLVAARKQAPAKDLATAKRLAAEAKFDEVTAHDWPTLKVTTSIAPTPKATLTETPALSYTTDNGDWSVFWRIRGEIRQGITSFGRQSAYKDAARAGIEAGTRAEKLITAEQDYLVRKLYFAFLISNDSEAYLEEKLEKLAKEVSKSEKKHLSNPQDKTKKTDYLKLKAFDFKYRAIHEQLLGMKRGAVYGLSHLTGMPESEINELDYEVEPEPVNASLTIEQALAALAEENDELAISASQVRGREFLHVAKQKEILPLVGLFAFGEYNVTPNRTDAKNPYLNDPFNGTSLGIGVGLTWDFDWFGWSAGTSETKAKLLESRASHTILETQKKIELRALFEDWKAAISGQKFQEGRYQSLKRITTLESLGSALGTSSAKEIMDAFKDQADARKDWLESVYLQNLKGAELARMIGASHIYPTDSLKGISTPE